MTANTGVPRKVPISPRRSGRTREGGGNTVSIAGATLGRRMDRVNDELHQPALEENVQTIREWQRADLSARSMAERFGDWVAGTAASGPVLLLHVVWFSAWATANVGWIPGVTPFDPFPFPFLTMTVSLEAIFLALFVLASQNRLSRQADKRSNLDLQIDLLAEREMTAVLRLLKDITQHLNVHTSVTDAQLRDLARKTDLPSLATKVEELAEAEQPGASRRSPEE